MSDKPLFDSNLLTYIFDNNEPMKQKVCRKLAKKCWEGKQDYTVSIQNLSEFYVAVTAKIRFPIPKELAREFIQMIIEFRGWRIITPSADAVLSAIEINTEQDIPYYDALIAATMKENGVSEILTENEKDFRGIPWLKVINPLR